MPSYFALNFLPLGFICVQDIWSSFFSLLVVWLEIMLFAIANDDFEFLSIFVINELSERLLFVEHLAVSMTWTTVCLGKEGCRVVPSTSWRDQSGDGKKSNGGSVVRGPEDHVCAQLTRKGSLGTDELSWDAEAACIMMSWTKMRKENLGTRARRCI